MGLTNWDEQVEYLRRTAKRAPHNPDYLRFLVRDVWGLDRPCSVVDLGCGIGGHGLWLLPLLAEGSSYVGVDSSTPLLAEARRTYAGLPYAAEFVRADVHDVPIADSSFDIAWTHAVLMHVQDPGRVVDEMIRLTRSDGMVITCEANRNGHTALLHIDETAEQERCPLSLYQTVNRTIRERTGVDYNIGMKMPVLLHGKGLRDIGCRISDRVDCLLPPFDGEMEAFRKNMCRSGFGPLDQEKKNAWRDHMTRWGVPEEDADAEIDRYEETDFAAKGQTYHTVYPHVLSFCWGRVEKAAGGPAA